MACAILDFWNRRLPCPGHHLAENGFTGTPMRWPRPMPSICAGIILSSYGDKRTGLASALVFLELNVIYVQDP